MADSVHQTVKHPVEAADFRMRQPVSAVCKGVETAKERLLSYHGVSRVAVETPVYQPVKKAGQSELTLQSAALSQKKRLSAQKAEFVEPKKINFDSIHWKKAGEDITLQELFAGQEGNGYD